jgi:uncharacterized protein (DUF169 family)
METAMNLPNLAADLTAALRLDRAPIGVAFVEDSAVPAGVPAFAGAVAAGCVFWQEAAKGPISTSTSDHEMCSIGVYTHNLADPSAAHGEQLGAVLGVLAGMQYARPEDVAQIPVLQSRPRQVLYFPLAESPVDPGVVLLFARANQGLILAEAIQQVESGLPPAMGRPACAVIPQVMNSGRAALSLGCCGARAYLSAMTDDIALWALPGQHVEKYVERIQSLAQANEVLTKFHDLRRQDVDAGGKPTYQESMARLQG